MAVQSKEAAASIKETLINMLIGTGKKQFISSTIILIILFLVHVKNKNSSIDDLKIKYSDKDKKKVWIF